MDAELFPYLDSVSPAVGRVGQVLVPDLDLNSFKYPEVRLLDQMNFSVLTACFIV